MCFRNRFTVLIIIKQSCLNLIISSHLNKTIRLQVYLGTAKIFNKTENINNLYKYTEETAGVNYSEYLFSDLCFHVCVIRLLLRMCLPTGCVSPQAELPACRSGPGEPLSAG